MLHGLCFGEEAGAQNLVFFPTLTCGVFVFSAVSAPSPPACPHTHTSLTHTHITSSHTHTTLTHSLTHTHTSLTHTHTSLTHTHTHPTNTHSGQCALPRGQMYAPVSLWRPLVSTALPVAFAWQAWDNVHCQGVGCTPRCPSGVPWSPPLCRWLLRGRCGTMWSA